MLDRGRARAGKARERRRREEGEATLQSVIAEHPDLSCGYAYMSAELGCSDTEWADYPRAITLLEEALAHPVVDAVDWDLEARLAELRARA